MQVRPLTSPVPLSKSRFMHGLQCPLWMWLDVRTDAKPREPTAGESHRFEVGHRVGELAQRAAAPGGVLVTAAHTDHAGALRETRDAIAAGAPSVYEATFDHGGVKARVDVLRRRADGGFDLIEVKSTSKYDKAKHLMDAAVQLWVARGAGADVRGVRLMHLDPAYVWPGGEYDLARLFALTDITAEAEAVQTQVAGEVTRLLAILANDTAPDPGESSCGSPHPCPFEYVCAEGAPEHPLRDLPRLGNAKKLWRELRARGFACVEDIDEAAADELLTTGSTLARYHAWECVREGGFVFTPGTEGWLARIEYPLRYLDFETVNPALPLIVGTRPYEVVPLQFSVHVQREPGKEPEHVEYIVPGPGDHRRELAERLLDALGHDGTVLEYHGNGGFERKRLEEIAALFCDLAPRIDAALARMLDLGDLMREHVFHPGMHGRWSIKVVQPVLAPDLPAYEGLAISDGDEAMVALYELIAEDTSAERRAAIRRDLLDYCEQDTKVMVAVLDGVRERVGA